MFPVWFLTLHTLKECDKTTEATFLEQPDFSQQIHHSKKLFSIPEVAEEDGEYSELLYKQGLGMPYKKNPTVARGSRPPRPYNQDQQHNFWYPAKHRISGMEDFAADDKGCKYSRSLSRSPDSGLDCGSEEEESRFNFRYTVSANAASSCCAETANCSCRKSVRPSLARRKTLTRQTSIEEDFGDLAPSFVEPRSEQVKPSYEKKYETQKYSRTDNLSNEDVQGGWKTDLKVADSRAAGPLAKPSHRDAEDSLVCEINLPSNICLSNQSGFFLPFFFVVVVPFFFFSELIFRVRPLDLSAEFSPFFFSPHSFLFIFLHFPIQSSFVSC